MGVLMENRHGWLVEVALTRTADFAERLAAIELLTADPIRHLADIPSYKREIGQARDQ